MAQPATRLEDLDVGATRVAQHELVSAMPYTFAHANQTGADADWVLEVSADACLEYELRSLGLAVERQRTLPVRYKEVLVDAGYRLDLFIEGEVIIEIKSVREINPIHRAQLLTYLKLSDRYLGLLLNFNMKRLKDGGIHRLVQGDPPSP